MELEIEKTKKRHNKNEEKIHKRERERRIVHASFVSFVSFSQFLTQPINLLLCHESLCYELCYKLYNGEFRSDHNHPSNSGLDSTK